ncbi:MAG: rod shape-determining protein MreC [Bacteroidetes bacterium]|nr:rod shape-determining protein MreC [Bacteroidota bacterium]
MKNIFLFIQRNFTFLSFLLLEIACIVLLSNSSKTHQVFFSSASNQITGKFDKQYNNWRYYFSLKETNAQLVAENARLRNLLPNNFQAIDESKKILIDSTVRDSLGKIRKFTLFPAKVIGNTVTLQTNYLTLERGSLQGIKKGMAVIGSDGIVGVVVLVSENNARVMSLLHRNSRVSAMLKKDNISGSIEWDGADPNFLLLKNIPKSAKVAKGDSVLTSTYSANFPSHLLIGTVNSVVVDATSNFYTLKIKTATNFFSIQYVYIVENLRYAEQTAIESTPEKN